MEGFRRLLWLLIVAIAFVDVYSEGAEKAEEPQERFMDMDMDLDGLFSGMDLNLNKAVNQGSTVMKNVQEIKNLQNGVSITKTVITHTSSSGSSNFPAGARFKRGLFDKIADGIDAVTAVGDKVSGGFADVVNVGYEGAHKIKDKIHNALETGI